MIKTAFALLLANSSAYSEEPKSPEALVVDYDVWTRESIVEIGGRKFRKVEFKGKSAYLELLKPEGSGADLQVICNEKGAMAANADQKPQVLAAMKVTKRTSAFIEGIRVICEDGPGGNKKISVDPALRVGFLLDDGNDPKALLRNKKIFISPMGLGFSADW